MPPSRALLEAEWLRLTREVLPGLARERGWPVRADHCFQRIILDGVFGGVWYDHVTSRPAYRAIGDGQLAASILAARAFADGTADLAAANARSLGWRRAARVSP